MKTKTFLKGIIALSILVLSINLSLEKGFLESHKAGNGFTNTHRGGNGFVNIEHSNKNGIIKPLERNYAFSGGSVGNG